VSATKEPQAKRNARAAKKKTDERREQAAGGVSGWVAERAGDWDLEGQDLKFMELQKYFWNPLMDFYFRMEIEGWERLPEPPALLIGIHSGAPFVWDAWTVGVQWWRHFGGERIMHGTAHDALMAAPLIGRYFRAMGVLPAAPDSIASALAAGHDVALWPGGEVDSLRPWTQRDEAILGGPDAMPVITRGRNLAKLLQLDKLARIKVMPFAISAPWGIAPAMLPEIPLPTKIRTSFQEPVKLARDPRKAKDDDYVERKYEEVRKRIQGGMDELARRRRMPLFG
jgi:1-acyl-sn-glycerol-3-phosphate acyltransferase